jgi:hypothetical protein
MIKQYSFLAESLKSAPIQYHIDKLKKILSKIKYGLRDPKTNKRWMRWNEDTKQYETKREDYYTIWRLATSKETISSGYGICWDTVEVIRDYLTTNTDIEFKMLFSYSDGFKYPAHTYVIYNDNGVWKWLEGSWHVFNNNKLTADSWQDAAKKITNELEKVSSVKYKTHLLDKYPKPGCDGKEFHKFCVKQRRII